MASIASVTYSISGVNCDITIAISHPSTEPMNFHIVAQYDYDSITTGSPSMPEPPTVDFSRPGYVLYTYHLTNLGEHSVWYYRFLVYEGYYTDPYSILLDRADGHFTMSVTYIASISYNIFGQNCDITIAISHPSNYPMNFHVVAQYDYNPITTGSPSMPQPPTVDFSRPGYVLYTYHLTNLQDHPIWYYRFLIYEGSYTDPDSILLDLAYGYFIMRGFIEWVKVLPRKTSCTILMGVGEDVFHNYSYRIFWGLGNQLINDQAEDSIKQTASMKKTIKFKLNGLKKNTRYGFQVRLLQQTGTSPPTYHTIDYKNGSFKTKGGWKLWMYLKYYV